MLSEKDAEDGLPNALVEPTMSVIAPSSGVTDWSDRSRAVPMVTPRSQKKELALGKDPKMMLHILYSTASH